MTKSNPIEIIIPTHNSPSPRKKLLSDFQIAFAHNDIPSLLHAFTENIQWHMLPDEVFHGIAEAEEQLLAHSDDKIIKFEVFNIITHGRSASVDGIFVFENGNKYQFCDIYHFNGSQADAKIKKMTSYVIQIP